MPHDREQMTPIARDLAGRGFAVWNLEYRRLGAPGGGWPGTFDDVAGGVDHLAEIASGGIDLDLGRVFTVGHSAGGQLALWAAAPRANARVRVAGACSQAGLCDLVQAHELRIGGGVVAKLLGGTPADVPDRYRSASPRARLPLGVPQLILHGAKDDLVPIRLSRDYAGAAIAAGDAVELEEFPAAGHFDFLDPASLAHAALLRWLAAR